MVDALNAEISLGTVGSINDAVQWLRYTYLYVRMRKNPLQYGMGFLTFHSLLLIRNTGLSREEVIEDPFINSKLHEFIQAKANQLAKARMITFDHKTEKLLITDLGRIAAKYYISHESIEVFNERCNAKMSEADVLHVLSKSSEVCLSLCDG